MKNKIKITKLQRQNKINKKIYTWEEFGADAKDRASALVSAFDSEDVELLDELLLFGFGYLSRHFFFGCCVCLDGEKVKEFIEGGWNSKGRGLINEEEWRRGQAQLFW